MLPPRFEMPKVFLSNQESRCQAVIATPGLVSTTTSAGAGTAFSGVTAGPGSTAGTGSAKAQAVQAPLVKNSDIRKPAVLTLASEEARGRFVRTRFTVA